MTGMDRASGAEVWRRRAQPQLRVTPPAARLVATAGSLFAAIAGSLFAAIAGSLLGGLVVLLLPATPASAHAALVRTSPAQGSLVATAPNEVILTFSESVTLVPGRSRVIA